MPHITLTHCIALSLLESLPQDTASCPAQASHRCAHLLCQHNLALQILDIKEDSIEVLLPDVPIPDLPTTNCALPSEARREARPLVSKFVFWSHHSS